jgi:hypothetical protein
MIKIKRVKTLLKKIFKKLENKRRQNKNQTLHQGRVLHKQERQKEEKRLKFVIRKVSLLQLNNWNNLISSLVRTKLPLLCLPLYKVDKLSKVEYSFGSITKRL